MHILFTQRPPAVIYPLSQHDALPFDEDDPCIETSVFMKRSIPNSGLVVIPRSGHAINLEEPDLFNRAVLDFLTAVESGSWTPRVYGNQSGSLV